jgi:hypothetical protein
VAFGILVAAFAVTVGALNATLYSASGFVGSYLDALARHDAVTARALPGVITSTGGATDLLTDAAVGQLSRLRSVSDVAEPGGTHTVTYEFSLGGQVTQTDFTVTQTGAFLGLFPTWTFAKSPLATVNVTVLHDKRFRVNGVQVVSPANQSAVASYLVFAPGLYTFDHASTYLRATPVEQPIADPGSSANVQVNVQANPAFVTQVAKELKKYLDKCAQQRVLLPTACPFGKTFDNRVDSTPSWKMVSYPRVSIIPGRLPGTWLVPNTDASAHLTVKVQSLFDGTVSTFDKDVPFTVAYSIRFQANDGLYIVVQYD